MNGSKKVAAIFLTALLAATTAWPQAPSTTQSAPEAPAILLNTFKGHTAKISCVAVSSDGKTVATGGADRTLRLWNTANGNNRFLLALPSGFNSVSFSADGTRLAAGAGDQVLVIDPATGKNVATLHASGAVGQVALSDNGKVVEASGTQWGTVWDVATGKETVSVKNGVPRGGFSADGKRVLVMDGRGTLSVWSVADNKAVATVHENGGHVVAAAFSPDGKWLAAGNYAGGRADDGEDKTLNIWDAATGKERFSLVGHVKGIYAVTFSSDGKRLWAADFNGSQKIWDAEHGVLLSRLEKTKVGDKLQGMPVGFWAVTPDFKRWVSGSEEDVFWYDISDFSRPGGGK